MAISALVLIGAVGGIELETMSISRGACLTAISSAVMFIAGKAGGIIE